MRTRRLAIGGTLLLVLVAVTAIGIGAVALTPGEVITAIAQQFGISVGLPVSGSTSSIVIELRAPRILAAIVVGAALAVAGGAFQSLLRNPLADPYVLGTSSGAALGAALAFLVPISGAAWELGGVQVAAFVGALLSVALVWRIAGIGSGEERIASILLVGYAVASLLAAALSLVMLTSGANLRAIFGFLLLATAALADPLPRVGQTSATTAAIKWAEVPEDSRECLKCHISKGITGSAIRDWQLSKHYGAGVGCAT